MRASARLRARRGERRAEKGGGREAGGGERRNQEPGAGRQEPGTRSQEEGGRKADEGGARSQEPGAWSQETGSRSQEPGSRSQEPEPSFSNRKATRFQHFQMKIYVEHHSACVALKPPNLHFSTEKRHDSFIFQTKMLIEQHFLQENEGIVRGGQSIIIII